MTAAQKPSPGKPDPPRIDDPLIFMRDQHDRQLGICDRLEALVDDMTKPAVPKEARGILANLTTDLALHAADEENVLFPLLRGRCPEASGIDAILEQLHGEHRRDGDLIERLAGDLRELAAGRTPAIPLNFIAAASTLIESQRRHIAWENNVVLPLAQRYLTQADRDDLAEALRSRYRPAG